jgi:hypothetical protein
MPPEKDQIYIWWFAVAMTQARDILCAAQENLDALQHFPYIFLIEAGSGFPIDLWSY